MINDYPVLIFFLIFASLIGILVLGYLATNNKFPQPLLKRAKTIYSLFSAAVLMLFVGGIIYAFGYEIVEKSGWIPRTREVPVYVKTQGWVTGEIRTCASFVSKEKK
jgi:hypothetical protein